MGGIDRYGTPSGVNPIPDAGPRDRRGHHVVSFKPLFESFSGNASRPTPRGRHRGPTPRLTPAAYPAAYRGHTPARRRLPRRAWPHPLTAPRQAMGRAYHHPPKPPNRNTDDLARWKSGTCWTAQGCGRWLLGTSGGTGATPYLTARGEPRDAYHPTRRACFPPRQRRSKARARRRRVFQNRISTGEGIPKPNKAQVAPHMFQIGTSKKETDAGPNYFRGPQRTEKRKNERGRGR